ncbi:hypothetical protein A7E78_06325 [Syntrophotalea acetylenivorans]|uniref:histidine kinase n=1 Tax=Syntrophotalea acetylenivorans TaxID=1842532 RepID=A0A1L3GNM1_9BACT|nr:PocR ligand-binding domain-containing protein [Syntrophotalea acetylenivorans]APG27490.1 hypothetical protein A7E78_06325 [Syntrophotalea acetylenivorans]
MQLVDLIEKNALDKILEALTEATQVSAVVVDSEGQPITAEHNFTTLCREYCRSTPAGRQKCYESDCYGGRESKRLKKRFIYTCLNAGLQDCATPIIVEGYHLATLVMGQVRTGDIPRAAAIAKAQSIGVRDIDGYLKALDEVPFMCGERLESIFKLMEAIAQTISSLALQKYLSQRAQQQSLHKLINSVSDAIVAAQPNGKITMVNKAGENMLGRTAENIVGRTLCSLFVEPETVRTLVTPRRAKPESKGPLVLDVRRPGRQIFPADVSFAKIYDEKGERTGYAAVMRDISEQKSAERMKEDLIGMLTHDMRNPILSIQRGMKILLDKYLGPLNDKQQELASLAYDSSYQLLGMVSDFLDIFRDESGGLSLCRVLVDMNAVLLQSLKEVRLAGEDKKLDICFTPGEEALQLLGDWSRLVRTCTNLLENAIRFSPEGGRISIAAELLNGSGPSGIASATGAGFQADGARILVTVTDQGGGIPKEHHKEVFEKFFSTKTKHENGRRGVGLGLAFCKLVAEAHGGSIWVESPFKSDEQQAMKGCRFLFALPVEDPRQEQVGCDE